MGQRPGRVSLFHLLGMHGKVWPLTQFHFVDFFLLEIQFEWIKAYRANQNHCTKH